MAKHVTTGTVKFVDGMKVQGSAGDHRMMLDSAPEHGGENAGFRPMELMALSIAGCTAMDVLSLLRKMRQHFTDLDVRVEAERAAEHPKVFTNVAVLYTVRGRNLDESKVKRAVELSHKKYCPAIGTVRGVAEINAHVEIIDEAAS